MVKHVSQFRRNQLLFCMYVLVPVFVLYSFLRFIPIGRTIVFSFQKWNLLDAVKPFVGLKNYIKMFHSPDFINSLKNTLLFVVYTVPLTVVIALALAMGLSSKRIKMVPFYQTVYFMPAVISMVPVAVVWKWIYDPSYGILNYFLSFFGVEPRAWLIDPKTALLAISAMSIWKVVGYYMVIFLVGIKGISTHYYEAAEIDGANSWQKFTRITLPLLKPITLFVVVVSSIRAFQVFTQVYVMTVGSQGAPGNVVRVLVYELFENGFRFFKMGYASAEAMILFLIVALFAVIQFQIGKER